MTVAATTTRLSERVRNLKPSATFAVTARVRELQEAGHDVIGFGAGEPDFDTPDSIKQVAIDALKAGQTGYQPVPGPLPAREAIADKLRRENGIVCSPNDVVINVGAKHSIYLCLQTLVDPGRSVIIPTPAWVSYRPMVELCGGHPVEVPGAVENDFKITPRQLEEAIDANTAVVMINSPSNPCGTMYAPAELEALAEVLAGHEHVSVISDEIYEKLIYGETKHLSLGSVEAIADRVVTVNGLSKAYAMTGWRIGYTCAPDAASRAAAGRGETAPGGEIARAVAKLQGQMTSHTASFSYPSIVEALTGCADAVETMRRTFAERAEIIHRLLCAMPGVVCPRPTGAFYAFPHIGAHFGRRTPPGRVIDSSIAFAEALLEEAKVAVVPGDDFGECAKSHVRMSFACGTDKIEEGCRRLAEWLGGLS